MDARAARAYVEFWAREKEEVDGLSPREAYVD